jgi:hypothetical protein
MEDMCASDCVFEPSLWLEYAPPRDEQSIGLRVFLDTRASRPDETSRGYLRWQVLFLEWCGEEEGFGLVSDEFCAEFLVHLFETEDIGYESAKKAASGLADLCELQKQLLSHQRERAKTTGDDAGATDAQKLLHELSPPGALTRAAKTMIRRETAARYVGRGG